MRDVQDDEGHHRVDMHHRRHDARVQHIGLDKVDDDDHEHGPQAQLDAAAVDGHEHDGHRGDEHAEHRDEPAEEDQLAEQGRRLHSENLKADSRQHGIERGNEELGAEIAAHHLGEEHDAVGRFMVGLGKAREAELAHPLRKAGQVQHDEEAEQHGDEEPAEIMQALLKGGAGEVPAVHHGGFRRDDIFGLCKQGRYHLVAAEVGVHPCADGLHAVRELFGEADGFGQKARRHERKERRDQRKEQHIDYHHDDAAAPAEAAAERMGDARRDKAHDIGDEHQPEHIPEKIEQGREHQPDEIHAVDADEIGNTEHFPT